MLRMIDLFAGIGGFRLGFELAASELNIPIECVFSNEINKHASETYNTNFNHMPDTRNIEDIPENEIPNHNILLGGFPCQPFSYAGKQLGFNDPRGTLIHRIGELMQHKQPDVVILENVPHILKHYDKDDNDQVEGHTFNQIKMMIKDIGYSFQFKKLNSRHFGVPHNRERVFIVCFRNDIPNDFKFPIARTIDKYFVGSILESNPDEKYYISDRRYKSAKNSEKVSSDRGSSFKLKIVDEFTTYMGTLTTQVATNNRLFIQQHDRLRQLTPRECARLQGFPETFIINPSDNQAYTQFGNAVTVPVVKEIALKVLQILQNNSVQ